jgi:hypothetical protein
MQSAEQLSARAAGLRAETDQLTVEVAIDSDRFRRTAPGALAAREFAEFQPVIISATGY